MDPLDHEVLLAMMAPLEFRDQLDFQDLRESRAKQAPRGNRETLGR